MTVLTGELIYRVVLIAVAFMVSACDDRLPPSNLQTGTVVVTSGEIRETVRVEFATTPAERQQGLMFRQELAEDAGMFFVFPADNHTGFWMRNTYVPLTIAYISADGTVLELRDGRPLDETILRPEQPYRYVLEVNQGWFERHGLGVGATVELPDDLPAAQ